MPALPSLPSVLRRKAVVVPVAAVLVAVTGFVGYGAYTRSQPVDYARGGDDFAVVQPEEPGATATPTASAAPSASTAPSVPGATAPATVAVATAGASAGPDVVQTTAPAPVTAPTRTAAGVVVPRTGSYGLRVEGEESVKFGAVSFCNQDLPSTTRLVVSKAAGEGPTSYDFDLGYFPGQSGKHDERHLYRYTSDAVFLDYEIATVTCQGVRQSSEVDYAPPQHRLELPLAAGKTWTYTGGSPDRRISSRSKVLRPETLVVAGEKVQTWVVQSDEDFSGNESGTRSQTWWYAPTWAMPVKWTEQISGGRSGASYRESVTVTVTSHP